jgi:adenine-specific DNA-methyltransferase
MKQFEKDGHKIFLGDALSILENSIDNNSVDLLFIDPPYNIGKVFGENKEKWNSD